MSQKTTVGFGEAKAFNRVKATTFMIVCYDNNTTV